MLGIGLMQVCLRAVDRRAEWKESWLKFSFSVSDIDQIWSKDKIVPRRSCLIRDQHRLATVDERLSS